MSERSESNGKGRRAPWPLSTSFLLFDRDMLCDLDMMASG